MIPRSAWLASLFVALATVRIAATYPVLSFTIDEPGHFACGLEYLSKHVYRYETQHPPLARAMIALGPYLAGVRPVNDPNRNVEGRAVMLRSGHLERTLALMRLGTLPFFWLACWIVFAWTRRCFDPPTAAAAVALFTLLPPVLAHAGLACTDMALAACVGAAFFALVVWAEEPGWKHAVLLGMATGLAVLSKFTALLYLPATAAIALLFYLAAVRPAPRTVAALVRARVPTFVLAVLAGALTIWAGYLFSFNKVPAPELFDGLLSARAHNSEGHPAYLLGKNSLTGWWYYFPVVLAVKTPVAFLVLAAAGTVARIRVAASFCLGILIPAMAGRVDIGVRLILPVYIGLAVIAAVGLMRLWRAAPRGRIAGAALVVWMAVSGAAKHPDYIAYFNEFAGRDPSRVLVDSDLDWGQDTGRLAARLRQEGANAVTLMLLEPLTWPLPVEHDLQSYYGLPEIRAIDAQHPRGGWTAISPTLARTLPFPFTPWYQRIAPTEKVGALWLYHFPEKGARTP